MEHRDSGYPARATDFSKELGRSELQLSCEATLAALADAGLAPSDVDGLVTFTMDSSSEIALARELGIGDLRFYSRMSCGGGATCATVQQAASAVATGVADVVVLVLPARLPTPAATVAMQACRYMHE